ncbi:NifU family protein [bacterium]|nr:NifU family protein [bacterium]MCB1220920.1 NifU family protein [bacterium]UNM07635.1 MAG: NifU family protein [Planctomycetales bacterium]
MSKVNDQHLDEIAAARAQTDYNRAVEPCGPSCGCAGPLRGAEEDFETRLKAALEKVRPFLQMDGGDLELVAIEDNNALIRLMGACQSCSISTVHMKMGVETAIKKEIPEFGELITID